MSSKGEKNQLNSAKLKQMHLAYVIFQNNEKQTNQLYSVGFQIKPWELFK